MSAKATSNNKSRSRTRPSSGQTLSSSMKKMSMKRVPIRMNVSISSISEEEAVLSFDDSGLSSMSSLTHFTCSSSSLQSSSLLSFGPVTQGPSLFETTNVERKGASAPKMPRRANDSRRNVVATLERTNNDHHRHRHDNHEDVEDDECNDIADDLSNGSLTLDDILEESYHSSTSTTTTTATTARQWSETASPSSKHGVPMPTRGDSFHHNSAGTWAFDSSTSVNYSGDEEEDDEIDNDDDDSDSDSDDDNDDSDHDGDAYDDEDEDDEDTLSYVSASSLGSTAEDSFAELNISAARCAV